MCRIFNSDRETEKIIEGKKALLFTLCLVFSTVLNNVTCIGKKDLRQ